MQFSLRNSRTNLIVSAYNHICYVSLSRDAVRNPLHANAANYHLCSVEEIDNVAVTCADICIVNDLYYASIFRLSERKATGSHYTRLNEARLNTIT